MKQGEVVIKLIANKTLKCRECHGYIEVGQPFLLDIIPYVEGYGVFRRVKKFKHIIHDWHWKGSKDQIIDRTG